MNYGIITLLPAILVIVLAIKTKRTAESLLSGCLLSYAIIGYHAGKNPLTLASEAFFKTLTDYNSVWLIIVCGLFGSLLAIIKASGGAQAIANTLEKKCKSQKKTLLMSWVMGVILFLDDYLNILTICACTKDLAQKQKIPRESLAYVIDSTGAPVCVLLPFSTWAIFFSGIFYEQQSIVNLGYGSAISTYIHVIPYMFYAIFTVFIVPLFIIGVLPRWGAMKKAYEKMGDYRKSNKYASCIPSKVKIECPPTQATMLDFCGPVGTLILIQLLTHDMFLALVMSLVVAAVLYLTRKRISGDDFCDTWIKGFGDSVPTLLIIASALFMRQASADLNLPSYIINMIEPFCNRNFFPAIAFIVVTLLGFTTGSNWAIPAVCAPIIIPLGAAIDANLLLIMAAIVCGGTFCSHMCFYSDAAVMTSAVCGIKTVDHFYTQLPYSSIALGLSIIAFLAAGFIL